MKMSHLAAATLVPATLAGALLTAMPFAQAAPKPAPVAARTAHHAGPAKPATAAKLAKPHHVTAHAVAHQPAGSSNTAGTAPRRPRHRPASPPPRLSRPQSASR